MYIILGGDHKEYGPETAEQIRQWVAEGRADARTLVKAEGTAEWKPLSAFPEFSSWFATTPPIISPAPAASKEQIPAANADLDVGSCLSRGWSLLMSNFPLLFGAAFLIGIVEYIPCLGIFLRGILFGGLFAMFLRQVRGQEAALHDAFSGFGPHHLQLLLAGFVSALLASIGYLFCALPGIYLTVAWVFCIALAMDKRLEFWSAMEMSRKVVNPVWFKVFGLLVIAFLPFLLINTYVQIKSIMISMELLRPIINSGSGDLATTIQKAMEAAVEAERVTAPLKPLAAFVFLLNVPFGMAALTYAYEDLFNPRPAPAA